MFWFISFPEFKALLSQTSDFYIIFIITLKLLIFCKSDRYWFEFDPLGFTEVVYRPCKLYTYKAFFYIQIHNPFHTNCPYFLTCFNRRFGKTFHSGVQESRSVPRKNNKRLLLLFSLKRFTCTK
jgi:hypothetical protein